MLHNFPFFLGVVILIVLLIMLAGKLRVAYPVLLVLAGLGISFIPGIPQVHIDSELIFIIFLPPLLYEAAWKISWKELWKWRRIVTSFAFLVVLFSAFAVALAANYFIPGFSLALGFLLGGIVSPPDAVSAGAILKFVKVPRRLSSILEGESLLNDASSLIIFRFALIAVATGQFIWYEAALSFSWMVIGGIAAGVVIGLIIMKLHKYLPTDANMDVALTLITPYLMYIAAEEVNSSGVLAVVAGGLYLSNHRFSFLASRSRLRSINVWDSLSFILNGLVFMLIGLDLPQITAGLGDTGLGTAIGYGLLVTLVLIVCRFVSAYAAVAITMIAKNFITVADTRHPGYRAPFLIGWSGMRGVVSLAAALSIPTVLADGSPFPQRNLILFITFIVILVTLLVQGLTLPYFIRKIKPKEVDYSMSDEEMSAMIRKDLYHYMLEYLNKNYGSEIQKELILAQIAQKWQRSETSDEDVISESGRKIYIELLSKQRAWLIERNKKMDIDEEIIRNYLSLLDIEQEKLSLI